MMRCSHCIRGAVMTESDGRAVCINCGHVAQDEPLTLAGGPDLLSVPSNGTGYSPLLAWRAGAATEHSGARDDADDGYRYEIHGDRHSRKMLGVADQ